MRYLEDYLRQGVAEGAFADRQGDWGRDLALTVGRMRCGLTLRELGDHAGSMVLQAMAKDCERKNLKIDEGLLRAIVCSR